MKYSFLLIFTLSTIISYCQLDFYECPINNKNEFINEAKLTPRNMLSGKDSLFFYWRIDTGSSIIFQKSNFYYCNKMTHQEVRTTLMWAIPKNQTSFQIEFQNIDSLNFPLVFQISCPPRCNSYNFDLIAGSGNIQGELIEKKWNISGKLQLTLINRRDGTIASKEISFDDMFVLWVQKKIYRKGHKFFGF